MESEGSELRAVVLLFPHLFPISRCSADVRTCDSPRTTCCNSYCKCLCTEVLSFQGPQQCDMGYMLPTKELSHVCCPSGREECIKPMELGNLAAKEVILQVSDMHTSSCFGQSFCSAMKYGLKCSLD